MDILADRDLVRVATMYYKEEMKQSDIAKQLGISRQLVSKYLVDARSKGIVEININSSSAYSVQLELKLQKAFGLKRPSRRFARTLPRLVESVFLGGRSCAD